jgi:transcriptional regulator with XRE-family HTH domain
MARAKKDITQIDLAKLLGVSKQSIANWENKNLRDLPKLENIYEIAEKLEVPITFLMGDKIKDIPTTEQNNKEQTPKVEYDFYKYLNKEYDLKENPELITQHFDFMENNPKICEEIPDKLGKWQIIRKLNTVEFSQVVATQIFKMLLFATPT